MPPPVRVKVYGLSLTRRGYFLWIGLGAVLFVVLFSVWLALFAGAEPSPAEHAGVSPWLSLWGFLRSYMPLLLLAAALLEGLEIYFVLRRFRRAEAEQAAGVPPPEPLVKGS